jgi:hypothetical protein
MIIMDAALSPMLMYGVPMLLPLMFVGWILTFIKLALDEKPVRGEGRRMNLVKKIVCSGLSSLAGLSINFAAASG